MILWKNSGNSIRILLKKYHPDNPNGSEEATKAINNEYDELFKVLKDKQEHRQQADNGKTAYSNMKYDTAEDELLRQILNKIKGFEGITIEIIGNWIWCFDSYIYRNELKQLGFKYAHKKKAWYYHTEAFRKRSGKQLSMDDIRNYYGSTEIQSEGRKKWIQA